MVLLVQRVAHGAALVAESGVRPGGLVVDGQDAAPVQEAFDGLEPSFSAAARARAGPGVGDGLLRAGDPAADDVLAVERHEWGLGPRPGGEDLRVEQDGARRHSSSAREGFPLGVGEVGDGERLVFTQGFRPGRVPVRCGGMGGADSTAE